MLEDYFLKPKTLDRIRTSWISESIEHYVLWLEQHGHSRQTMLPPIARLDLTAVANGVVLTFSSLQTP